MGESVKGREDGLPEGWVWTTIGNITRPVEKVKPEERPEVHFTYLDISSINNESYRITEPKAYKGAEAPSRARQLVEAHDVLFSTVRTYLKNIALVQEIYDGEIASTGFSVLRSKPNILPKYLFYYSVTDRFVSELSKLQRGTSYPAVRDEDVRTREIPLAPLSEQHRIVEAIETQFTRLDAAVAALERARANLKRYRASVLQAACEGRLVPTEAELARERGRAYEPADALLARILAERRAQWEEERWAYEIERAKKKAAQAERKAAGLPYYIRDLPEDSWIDRNPEEYEPYLPKSDKWKQKYDEPQPPDTEGLPELTEGWVYTSLEPLLEVRRSGLRTGPFGSLLKKSEHQPTGVPVLGIENIGPEGFVYGARIHISKSKALELAKYNVQPSDILISRSGTVGEVCVVPEGLGIARFSTNLIRVVLMPDGMLPEFFRFLFIGALFVLSQVSDLCSGSTSTPPQKF